jgi:hypothetical protein
MEAGMLAVWCFCYQCFNSPVSVLTPQLIRISHDIVSEVGAWLKNGSMPTDYFETGTSTSANGIFTELWSTESATTDSSTQSIESTTKIHSTKTPMSTTKASTNTTRLPLFATSATINKSSSSTATTKAPT